MMDNDDEPVGRLLTRREALRAFARLGAVGAAFGSGALGSALAGCGSKDPATDTTGVTPNPTATCVARPALTEGPYFVDEKLVRSDIRTDPSNGTVRPGIPLALTFGVTSLSGCTPLAGALIDVWHCDHLGVYSDVTDGGFNTVGQKFLRGQQVTDADGQATFTTIFPGWYSGRAVHIHFKLRSAASATHTFEFTSQLFFDDALLDAIHAQAPYATKGQRNVRNAADGIYKSGGSQLLLAPTQTAAGYAATFNLALQGV